MFSMMMEEHSGTLTTEENQAQRWNTSKPKTELSTSITLKQVLTPNPLNQLVTWGLGKSSWALLDTHRTRASKSKSRKHLGSVPKVNYQPTDRRTSALERGSFACERGTSLSWRGSFAQPVFSSLSQQRKSQNSIKRTPIELKICGDVPKEV